MGRKGTRGYSREKGKKKAGRYDWGGGGELSSQGQSDREKQCDGLGKDKKTELFGEAVERKLNKTRTGKKGYAQTCRGKTCKVEGNRGMGDY